MNNHLKNIVLLLMLSAVVVPAAAQQGFGTNTPHPSSVVDMEASDKGVLLPRVALTSTKDNLTVPTPATNLLVFNTAATGDVTPGFYYWSSSAWIRLLCSTDIISWSSTGNAGTTPGTNFIGTTDAQDLVFKTNATNDGTEKMRVTTTGSVGIGTAPNAAAKVDISSTTQGFLPPRMTAAQMAVIASPAEGMMVYNTTLHCLAYYSKGAFNCAYKTPSAPMGSNATGFYNGWVSGSYTGTDRTVTHAAGEAFSTNTTCASKTISVSGCGGATTVTGVSGNTYALKEINGQCWTAENMREIPSNFSGINNGAWTTNTPGDMGYWGYYNVGVTSGSASWGTAEPTNPTNPTDPNWHEGMLYQWSAAMNGATAERSQGICPSGFHVPSDCEFMYLEHGLGMKVSDQVSENNRGDGAEVLGSKLTKDIGGNNVSGFSTLFAGARAYKGVFWARRSLGLWWSSSVVDALTAIGRYINTPNNGIDRDYDGRENAFSVRCLKN